MGRTVPLFACVFVWLSVCLTVYFILIQVISYSMPISIPIVRTSELRVRVTLAVFGVVF